MNDKEIVAAVAKIYGVDPKEADLGLRYTAASRELAQRTTTATEQEATLLKGLKRIASLRLDLYQRVEAVRRWLPERLTDDRQSDLASQLHGTAQELCKAEKTLLGKLLTPIDNLVTKANRSRNAYRYAKLPKTETPRRKLADLAA